MIEEGSVSTSKKIDAFAAVMAAVAGRRAEADRSLEVTSAGSVERQKGVEGHPQYCDPKECLAESQEFGRHRSAASEIRLQEDAYCTRLVARVTEAVCEPGKLYLEVEVYPDDDSDEPHHTVQATFNEVVRMFNFFLKTMVEAAATETMTATIGAFDATARTA